mmetsp:Transcript_16164/g.41549  ORF Transcript_16164/g.41549 Transcript_16164/m.41549 type:complete len:239 (-) Transcript_16164:495-1211(-)
MNCAIYVMCRYGSTSQALRLARAVVRSGETGRSRVADRPDDSRTRRTHRLVDLLNLSSRGLIIKGREVNVLLAPLLLLPRPLSLHLLPPVTVLSIHHILRLMIPHNLLQHLRKMRLHHAQNLLIKHQRKKTLLLRRTHTPRRHLRQILRTRPRQHLLHPRHLDVAQLIDVVAMHRQAAQSVRRTLAVQLDAVESLGDFDVQIRRFDAELDDLVFPALGVDPGVEAIADPSSGKWTILE